MWCAFWNRELRTVGIDIDDHAAQCDVKSSARCAIDNGLKHIYRNRYITQPNDDKLYSAKRNNPDADVLLIENCGYN
jgi:hypothetical protein